MKMNRIFTIVALLVSILTFEANAQIAFDRDTAYVPLYNGVSSKGDIRVTNNSGSDLAIDWRLLTNTLNTDWYLQFCDFYTCYTNDFGPLPTSSQCSGSCNLLATFDADWYLDVTLDGEAPSSEIWQIEVTTDTDTTVLTWITQNHTGVEDLKSGIEYIAYPIPASNELNVRIVSSFDEKHGQIYDMSGKMVKSFNFSGTNKKLDVADLIPGEYIMVVKSDSETLVKQVFSKY